MATTTIDSASFQLACAECADAIESSTWATAWIKYAKAEAIHAGLEVQVGQADVYIRRRETLAGLRLALKSTQAQASGAADNRRLIRTETKF